MQIIKKYSIIAIFTLSIVTGLYNNILSFAQEANQTQAEEEGEICKQSRTLIGNERIR